PAASNPLFYLAGSPTPPQAWNKCTQLAEVLTYADWSDYQVDYMGEIYSRLRAQIPAELPCVLNVNPPTDDWFGSDAWLTRINPDRWLDVHYGFTNWIGVACDDRTVVDRYQLMIKRARGSNYEENWGFSKLYEPAFAYDAVSYYQTLIEVASGATGYNIYTGVGTARTSPELDISSRTVYPDVSPIDEHGRVTPKGETVRKLNRFFEHCSDFVETRPRVSVAWGAYLPYSHIRAWTQESEQARLNELGVGDGGRAFMNFEHRLLNQHLDFGLVNLQAAPLSQLQGYRTLGLAAGRWMERATQDKLRAYVEGGGNLLLVGDLPSVDENLESYDGLQAIQDRIHLLNETEFYQSDDWIELALPGEERTLHALNRAGSDALIWVYEHPVSDVQYLFVFTRSDPGDPVTFEYRTSTGFHLVKVTLPSKSAGVLRVEDGRLSAALIKGENDYTGETIIPACDIDGVTVRAQEPGDWLMI
ncbi:MAG TPA: hypothetical protein VHO48_10370, partial [Anaerolineaceae bacterium]|nr:hypothetical protein [Anaerolineaceae bacterium]